MCRQRLWTCWFLQKPGRQARILASKDTDVSNSCPWCVLKSGTHPSLSGSPSSLLSQPQNGGRVFFFFFSRAPFFLRFFFFFVLRVFEQDTVAAWFQSSLEPVAPMGSHGVQGTPDARSSSARRTCSWKSDAPPRRSRPGFSDQNGAQVLHCADFLFSFTFLWTSKQLSLGAGQTRLAGTGKQKVERKVVIAVATEGALTRTHVSNDQYVPSAKMGVTHENSMPVGDTMNVVDRKVGRGFALQTAPATLGGSREDHPHTDYFEKHQFQYTQTLQGL